MSHTTESLAAKNLAELKAIASNLGFSPSDIKDAAQKLTEEKLTLSAKSTWVSGIIALQPVKPSVKPSDIIPEMNDRDFAVFMSAGSTEADKKENLKNFEQSHKNIGSVIVATSFILAIEPRMIVLIPVLMIMLTVRYAIDYPTPKIPQKYTARKGGISLERSLA